MLVPDTDEPVDPGGYTPPPPPPPTSYPPAIITASLPPTSIGAPYNQVIQAINGTPPYTFSVSAGALPPGLALAPATGVISGTATASGSFTFLVTVTDAAALMGSAPFTIVIPSSPDIATVSLPLATVGIPYTAGLIGEGGAQPYGFQVTAGGLPSGLVLAATGGITGTPTVVGSFSVTFQVYDSNSPQGMGTKTFTLVVQASNLLNPVTTMDECVMIASPDGGLYLIIPGQRHDQNYAGQPIGFTQVWNGVPGPSAKLGLQQLGGASVSAKGNGALVVTAIDDNGVVTPLSTDARPMFLNPQVETKRDFMAKGAMHSERFGIAFSNGGVVDAWFEAHVAILWVRPFFSGRKG